MKVSEKYDKQENWFGNWDKEIARNINTHKSNEEDLRRMGTNTELVLKIKTRNAEYYRALNAKQKVQAIATDIERKTTNKRAIGCK